VLEESYITPDLDNDLSSDDEEEEEDEIGEEIHVVTNDIQMPLVVTKVQLGETIVIDATLNPEIEELTKTIDRLREQLVNMNVELVKAQLLLCQNCYRQRHDMFSTKPIWNVNFRVHATTR
jgi:poly(A) polymerase Pap1